MIQGSLALKLKDFEEDYCDLHLVEDCKQNLPDNIIQFPKAKWFEGTVPQEEIVNYGYNNENQLLSVDNGQGQALSLQYDNNGNMVSKTDKITLATTAYIYNAENQLIRIDLADGTYAEYRYDGLGRRIQKDVNGTIAKYVYDGEDILLEYDGANTLTARYTHGQGIDEPLVMEREGVYYFYHVDGLGSITALTDTSGNILQAYIYDSFGNIVEQTGSLINPYAYTGREFDAESELYYYRARYYDTRIGRFLQEDPILKMNLYLYCENNPVNLVDPTGELEPFTMGVIIGGAISGWDLATTYAADKYYEKKYGINMDQPKVYAEKATFGAVMALIPLPGSTIISKTFQKGIAIAMQSWLSYGAGEFAEFIKNIASEIFWKKDIKDMENKHKK